MTEYNLVAWVPYERGFDELFNGTEEDLREFIRKNVTKVKDEWRHNETVTKVCGYELDDLEITITGPDVRSYIED